MKIKELLEKTHEPNRPAKATPSEESPEVGIFWIDLENKKLRLVFAEPVKSILVKPNEESISGSYDHYPLWENLKRSNLIPDKWKDKEYEYVPRGRVIYDAKRKRYRVYASKKIVGRKWFQERIISEFFLPRNDTEFESDLHYEDPRSIGKRRLE